MNTRELDDWAAFLDRELMSLRGSSARPDSPAFAMLDTSYAELQAASLELKAQTSQVERVAAEAGRARRRLDTLLSLTPDAILETDHLAVIREANSAASHLLKVRSEYLRNKPLILFVAESDRQLVHAITHGLTERNEVVSQELRLQPRDGTPIPARIRVTRLDGVEGEKFVIMWLIRDAAERAADLSSWRATRDQISQEVIHREAMIKDLDNAIGDRLSGIRKLARRVLELQDMEGHKVARELKERFGQNLAAVRLNLESLAKTHPELRGTPVHREALKLVDAALQRLREIYFELSPPLAQGIGLTGMIRQILARIPEPEHLKTSLEADPLPLISPQVESAALWVAREAIHNTVRHSGASILEVKIQREGSRLVMLVRDNGRGFSLPSTRALAERAGCFGLVGMEERVAILGGDLQIISAPRQGTEVRVMFPAAARE